MLLRKTHVSPPRAFLRARCWRKAKNEIWPFWNGSVYKGKKNMQIYIWTSIRAIILWSLKALGQRVLTLLSGNSFNSSGHRDLDLWSTDPKPIGFFYSIRAIILWRVIERKRSVTDGQTDRQPDGQGKNNMSPPEGGGEITIKPLLYNSYWINIHVLH